jgi:hypothetical protein
MAFAALLLFLQAEEAPRRDPFREALIYLARHQTREGSWGATPPACTCPRETAPLLDESGRRRVRELTGRLSHEQAERREAAERELRAIGRAALDELQRIESADPEVRGRIQAITNQLRLSPERPDAEVTSLAILAFAGGGYGAMSQDVYGEWCFGTVTWKGIEWIRARDGPFVALALSQSYLHRWQADLQRIGWGVSSTDPADSSSTAWRAIALDALMKGEHLPKGSADLSASAARLETSGSEWEACAAILTGRDLRRKNGLCGFGVSQMTPGTNRLIVVALDAQERPEHRLIHRELKDLSANQVTEGCERGSWQGEGLRRRLVETSRRALALAAAYYPYDSR